jgi:PPK2 family polyphosphate:nucleotide phosphotransferase
MNIEALIKKARTITAPFKVSNGRKFRLRRIRPDHAAKFGKKQTEQCKKLFEQFSKAFGELQELLYADHHYGIPFIVQGRDASKKSSSIQRTFRYVNPNGFRVYSIKAPNSDEVTHDYLWRIHSKMPARGHITVFDRSHVEEVLVVRVHPEFLKRQGLPQHLINDEVWNRRMRHIRSFEEHLASEGFPLCKCFLHVSREKQRKRLLARIEDTAKHEKFSIGDIRERDHWNKYDHAFEKMIRGTATRTNPWIVIPADKKWFARLVMAAYAVEFLHSLRLSAKMNKVKKSELREAQRLLIAQGK